MTASTLWRYTAIDLKAPSHQRRGELSGSSAAEVRASLRRIGLQVLELKPLGVHTRTSITVPAGVHTTLVEPFIQVMRTHLRNRRRAQRAELYDSLSTMLQAGLPLLEAVGTLIESSPHSMEFAGAAVTRGAQAGLGPAPRANASMLTHMREGLRAGESLGQAMALHPAWFDQTDVAIVEAGQHSGTLSKVLASMADRQEKVGELGHKLIGALAYPFLVLLVGLGVVIFLSVKTLPELVKILTDAGIPAPGLTVKVMWVGQLLVNHWLLITALLGLLSAATVVGPALARFFKVPTPRMLTRLVTSMARRLSPKVLRTMALGNLALSLAELLRSGVPVVDSLRVIAPTVRSRRLRHQLSAAAQRIEQGDDLSAALDDPAWFNAEFRRLLDIGQASGELDQMLDRLGHRYQRQARRLIDRLATMLEPAVILGLAVLVGIVVMAAILPLIRLQEIL